MKVCRHGCDVSIRVSLTIRFLRVSSKITMYFIKAIEHFFCVYIASSKHSEGWENS